MSAITNCISGVTNATNYSISKTEADTVVTSAINMRPDSASNKPKIKFDPTQKFEIISAKTGTTKASSKYPDTSDCKGWTIPTKAIPGIIKSCKFVSGEELHYGFEVLPCIVSGTIQQNGHQFKYEINAGSWLWIASEDTTMLMANSKKQNEKYFITNEWDGKE